MSDPFARMNSRLFAHLGDEAVLRSTDNCRASIEDGVAITGDYGEVTSYRKVADIYYDGIPKPKKGDSLTIATPSRHAGTYKLDAPLKDDGYSAHWILL